MMNETKRKRNRIVLNGVEIAKIRRLTSTSVETMIRDVRNRNLLIVAETKSELLKQVLAEIEFMLDNLSALDLDHPIQKALAKKVSAEA